MNCLSRLSASWPFTRSIPTPAAHPSSDEGRSALAVVRRLLCQTRTIIIASRNVFQRLETRCNSGVGAVAIFSILANVWARVYMLISLHIEHTILVTACSFLFCVAYELYSKAPKTL